MKNIIQYVALIFTTFIVSCKEDNFLDGNETTLTGSVMEGNFNTPIQGAKIYIWQYGRTNDLYKSQTFRQKIVDSAVTDNFGKYAVSFRGTTSAVSYKPDFQVGKEYYFMYPNKELERGSNNALHLVAYKACILKAKVVYSDNLPNPLNVHTYSEINPSWHLSTFKLYGPKVDTTLMITLIPNKANHITFNFFIGYNPVFYSEIIKPNLSLDTLFRSFNLSLKDFKR